MSVEKVRYYAIDGWNRPVFRSVDFPKNFFGSTDILFPVGAEESEVLAKVGASDLVYFGSRYNCEPMGVAAPGLEIVRWEQG